MRALLHWNALKREQAADRVFADAVGEAPGRAVVKEFETGGRAGSETGIGLNAALEFGFEGRIFGEVFAGEFFEDVGFAVLALFEDGIEEAPAEGGVGGLGLEPVDSDLGESLVEGDDDGAGGEGHLLRGKGALAEAAGLGPCALSGEDGMAAFEGRPLPLHLTAAVAL